MAEIKKHGNIKFRFDLLQKAGDKITAKPSNLNSLKTAFRKYKEKNGCEFEVSYIEYTNGHVDIYRKPVELPA